MTFVELVSDGAQFETLAPVWDDLVRAAPRPAPYLLHAWVAEWCRHYGEQQMAILVAWRGETLCGALPLVIGRRNGVRVAEFVGRAESALGDLLLADRRDHETASALLEETERLQMDVLGATGLPGGSNLSRAAGNRLTLMPRVEAPVLEMPDGWEVAYPLKANSKKRNLHRRRARQLDAFGEVRWEVARTSPELAGALDDAFRLHGLRWHGRPDTSSFGTEIGQAFQRAATLRLAKQDIPRIVTLFVDDKAVAFHYYFSLSGTMYVHRLAFDPAISECSPGLLTLLHTLQIASDEGCRRCEFQGGDERYKLELSDRIDPMYLGVGLAHTTLGKAAMRTILGRVALRRKLKRSSLARWAWEAQARLRARRTPAGPN